VLVTPRFGPQNCSFLPFKYYFVTEMSVTMEQMLESVTDAISAMVIFAAEAASNSAVLRNLAAGAQGVATAVNYLVGQANSTVGLWEKVYSLFCL
jgi:hypothetical protein